MFGFVKRPDRISFQTVISFHMLCALLQASPVRELPGKVKDCPVIDAESLTVAFQTNGEVAGFQRDDQRVCALENVSFTYDGSVGAYFCHWR